MQYYNGYTNSLLSEAEVKGLNTAKIEVRDTTYNAATNERMVTSVFVFPHILTDACRCYKCNKRELYKVADIIKKTWGNKVWFGAVPYLQAMRSLSSIDGDYGVESGKSIVIYFLSNAAQYKGTVAKHIKSELKYYAGLK